MTYLLILMVLSCAMAAIDARHHLFVFSQPVPALVTLLGATAFFLLWDDIAIDRGIFLHRESPLMTGAMLGDQLPLEEAFFLLFFCYQAMLLILGFGKWRAHRAAAKGNNRSTTTKDVP
ncbi:lycopene cyclase domain-containing protein [Arthrobacter sp. A2-55]|nr:lycopene cyclase domain-containing protein [Arthrobacter sp. A2-55]